MNMSNQSYVDLVESRQKKPKVFVNCLKAFLVGGIICTVGEVLSAVYKSAGADDKLAWSLVSITLIVLAELLTAFGVFYYIAKFAGAGTLVPITGFANAIASPAIDTSSEGYITGVGVNMFKIAGPVIVYGTLASMIYGIIYFLSKSL